MSIEKTNVNITENGVVNEQDNAQVSADNAQETVKELPKINLEEFKQKITIKRYIPFSSKKSIVDLIYTNCVVKDEENGIYFIDTLMKEMAYNFAILDYYTDFYDVYENAREYSYDEIAEAGIFRYITNPYCECRKDIGSLDDAIYRFNDRVNALNSIGASLYRILNGLSDKMPDINELGKLMQELPKVLNKVDPKVIEMFSKDLKNGTV